MESSVKYNSLSEYLQGKMIDESKTSWKDMKDYAESWMRQETKKDDMKFVVFNVLEGMAQAIQYKLTGPRLTPKEQKDCEEVLDMVQDLINTANNHNR